MKPRQDQINIAKKGVEIIKKYNLVYLAGQERTGKSLCGVLIFEDLEKIDKILVITKKAAIKGWLETLNMFSPGKFFEVINYHSVHKIRNCPQGIILDEAHAHISSAPKRSKMWERIATITINKPIVFMSATPYAQGPYLLFNQLALSSWSPWMQFKNYYRWYNKYAELDKNGDYKQIFIGRGVYKKNYKAVDKKLVLKDVSHLFITATRKDLGFKQEPKDVVHFIDLTPKIKNVYNILLNDKVLYFENNGKDYTLICDTSMKLRFALHMLEGGVLKVENEYIDLCSNEKVSHILKIFGDSKEVVIMYEYKADKIKLEKYFKKAKILQATTYAEGINLFTYKHLIIYSQNFSTAKHSQRRARQTHPDRKESIKVNYLLVKNAISHQVYKTVSINKTNFVDSVFEPIKL